MGIDVLETHSRKSQGARTRASEAFRNGKGLIMFTSDVSARGMDFPDVSLVIQVGIRIFPAHSVCFGKMCVGSQDPDASQLTSKRKTTAVCEVAVDAAKEFFAVLLLFVFHSPPRFFLCVLFFSFDGSCKPQRLSFWASSIRCLVQTQS